MMQGNGMGFNWRGMYTTSLLDRHAGWRARANELSRTLKISMMIGEYFIRQYGGHFYAKAQTCRGNCALPTTTPCRAVTFC